MNILIHNTTDQPIYDQIYTQMKQAILSGELKEGDSLPSIRTLAKDLRISVITTKRAYEELEKSGYIITVAAKGSYVAPKNLDLIREENLTRLEEYLQKSINLATVCGLSQQELVEMLRLLYEGEPI